MAAPKLVSVSFSGCGFLGMYHVGALARIRELVSCGRVEVAHASGASAGALVATALILDIPEEMLKEKFRELVDEARSRSMGPLHPGFDVNQIFGSELERVLPEDSHLRVRDRLSISLTEPLRQNRIISDFTSKEDLIEALICSCFLPVFSSNSMPQFRGTGYLDGGLSNNQPVHDSKTIKVSPFSGASHVCPKEQDDKDNDSTHPLAAAAKMAGRLLGSEEMELSGSNLRRLVNTILPAKDFEQLYRDGYKHTEVFFDTEELLNKCVYSEEERAELFGKRNGAIEEVEEVKK